jgi:hypothetical protein
MAALVVGTALAQTGILGAGPASPTEISRLLTAGSLRGRCEEVVRALTDAKVLLAPLDEGVFTVNGQQWDLLPPEIRDGIVRCVSEAAPGEPANEPIEVRKRSVKDASQLSN